MKKSQKSASNVATNKKESEIDQLEFLVSKNPDFAQLYQLANLYLNSNKSSKCKPHLDSILKLFRTTRMSFAQGLNVLDVMLKYWKSEKYITTKGTDMRLNLTTQRSQYLNDITDVMKILFKMPEGIKSHVLSLRKAYVLECIGDFQNGLAVLSDLIALQAMDGVDLSYIIFKAAVILNHIGQIKQAVEYLEFIIEDPPVMDGFTKSHIIAFLTLVYELAGDKYKQFLAKSYQDLQSALKEDMPNSKALTNAMKNNFTQQSDIWETFAVQSIDRCEYVLAIAFLTQAIHKAPTKVKLLHLLAELYTTIKQIDIAIIHAEKAYQQNPQSSELRNLLLQLAPSKWTENLRSIPSTAATAIRTVAENEVNESNEGFDNDMYPHMNSRSRNMNKKNEKDIISPAREEPLIKSTLKDNINAAMIENIVIIESSEENVLESSANHEDNVASSNNNIINDDDDNNDIIQEKSDILSNNIDAVQNETDTSVDSKSTEAIIDKEQINLAKIAIPAITTEEVIVEDKLIEQMNLNTDNNETPSKYKGTKSTKKSKDTTIDSDDYHSNISLTNDSMKDTKKESQLSWYEQASNKFNSLKISSRVSTADNNDKNSRSISPSVISNSIKTFFRDLSPSKSFSMRNNSPLVKEKSFLNGFLNAITPTNKNHKEFFSENIENNNQSIDNRINNHKNNNEKFDIPKKPKLKEQRKMFSKEETKMLNMVLNGNKNVHLYDPTLEIIRNYRCETKK